MLNLRLYSLNTFQCGLCRPLKCANLSPRSSRKQLIQRRHVRFFMCRPLFNTSEEEKCRLKHEVAEKLRIFPITIGKKWQRKQIRIAQEHGSMLSFVCAA